MGTLRIVVASLEKTVGDNHLQTLATTYHLGIALESQGKLKEAEQFMRKSLEGRRHVLGGSHPDTKTTIQRLAGVLKLRIDQSARAESLAIDALITDDLDIVM